MRISCAAKKALQLVQSLTENGRGNGRKEYGQTPVFKKDNPLDRENYWPITVLSAVDKVLEQLISKQITTKFGNYLEQCLTAYRKSHSCETTLITLVEHWKLAKEKGESVAVLSTDMSKTFDSLHPPLMLSKLRAYGFEENTLNLLRFYLTDCQSQTGSRNKYLAHCEQGMPPGICPRSPSMEHLRK